MSKLQKKLPFFKKSVYLPSCITSAPIPLFTLATQSLKSVEKNLAYQGLLNFCHKHSMPLLGHAKWNFEHNSCHKQTKLLAWSPYSIFVKWKWIVKAKSVSFLRNALILTLQFLLKGRWLAQQTPWFSQTGVSVFFENLVPISQHKWWKPYLDITIFLKDAWIFHWFIFSFKSWFFSITPSMESLHILSVLIFYMTAR